jgi:hypothetical protein
LNLCGQSSYKTGSSRGVQLPQSLARTLRLLVHVGCTFSRGTRGARRQPLGESKRPHPPRR